MFYLQTTIKALTAWFFGLKNRSYFRADKRTPLPIITDDVISVMNKIYDVTTTKINPRKQ